MASSSNRDREEDRATSGTGATRRPVGSDEAMSRQAVLELVSAYRRTGDRNARNELVEAHQHVADFFARRYSGRGVARDDLRQVGLLAILRAVDRFDPDLGVSFGTFASRTVDGELKRYFRDRTWSVRPPRQAQELHLVIRRSEETLAQRLGRSPTVAELARDIGEDEDHILEAMEAGMAHEAASLDAPPPGDRTDAPWLTLGQAEVGYAQVDLEIVMQGLLQELGDRERRVVYLRFYENRTQSEIAAEVGVSQSYLSRILRNVFVELRRRLEGTAGS